MAINSDKHVINTLKKAKSFFLPSSSNSSSNSSNSSSNLSVTSMRHNKDAKKNSATSDIFSRLSSYVKNIFRLKDRHSPDDLSHTNRQLFYFDPDSGLEYEGEADPYLYYDSKSHSKCDRDQGDPFSASASSDSSTESTSKESIPSFNQIGSQILKIPLPGSLKTISEKLTASYSESLAQDDSGDEEDDTIIFLKGLPLPGSIHSLPQKSPLMSNNIPNIPINANSHYLSNNCLRRGESHHGLNVKKPNPIPQKLTRCVSSSVIDTSLQPLTNQHDLDQNLHLFSGNDVDHLDSKTGKIIKFHRQGRRKMPRSLIHIPNLVQIDGSSNMIRHLPEYISRMVTLRELYLSSNDFREFPNELLTLSQLSILDLSKNKIQRIPHQINSLSSLNQFNISSNRIKYLPELLFKCQDLDKLNLQNNPIRSLPNRMPSLIMLNLSNNEIELIEESIYQIISLKELILSSSNISYMSPHLSRLTGLTRLDLSYNKLSFPRLVVPLRLIELDISNNFFTEFPYFVYSLTQLKRLSISNNQIRSILPEIAQLKQLNYLDISGNGLSTLPYEIGAMPLTRGVLNVENNPLSGICGDFSKSNQSIMDYLKIMNDNPSWRYMKCVILGSQGVGKTSLFNHFRAIYSCQQAKPKLKSYYETIMESINTKRNRESGEESTSNYDFNESISGSLFNDPNIRIEDWKPSCFGWEKPNITFSLWDFGPVVMFHLLHRFFLSKHCIYVIVFNILQDSIIQVESWLRMLKLITGGSVLGIVVGTHLDDNRADKRYCKHVFDAMKRRFDNRFPFIRHYLGISNKNGRDISKLVAHLIRLGQSSKFLVDCIPKSYQLFQKRIKNLSHAYPIISFDDIIKHAVDVGIRKDYAPACIEFMNNSGILIHYDSMGKNVNSLIVLNPLWLVDLIKSVVNIKNNYTIDAMVLSKHIPLILDDFSREKVKWIVTLLENFETAFLIRSEMLNPLNSTWLYSHLNKVITSYPDVLKDEPIPTKLDQFPSTSISPSPTKIQNPIQTSHDIPLLDVIMVPSLLSDRPIMNRIESLWNNDQLFHKNICGRQYGFQFLPLGIFARFIFRIIHISDLDLLYFWKKGMIVDYMNERALIISQENDYKLDIYVKHICRSSPSDEHLRNKNTPKMMPLIRKISENVETVLLGWYQSQPIINIPCNICLMEKCWKYNEESQHDIYYFPIVECMLAVKEGITSIKCKLNLPSPPVPQVSHKVNIISKLGQILDKQVVDIQFKPYRFSSSDHLVVQRSRDPIKNVSVPKSSSLPKLSNSYHTNPLRSPITLPSMTPSPSPSTTHPMNHNCLIKDLCSDIAFFEVRDITIPFDALLLNKMIGQGSYSVLWQSEYNNQLVAVKILKNQENQVDMVLASFLELQHETFLMKDLQSPYLAKLLGICIKPLSMIMEYFPMGSLDRYLHQPEHVREFSWKYRIRVAYCIAMGIDYLHSEDVIHRDVRSPNILVLSLNANDEMVAKVADFGLAVVCGKNMRGGDFNECWTAPEIFKADEYNGKVDQYSFGIVLWELLQQGFPFYEYASQFGGKPRIIFFNAVIAGLRPTIPEKCPVDYARLIRMCWATEPDERPNFSIIAEELVYLEKKCSQWPELLPSLPRT